MNKINLSIGSVIELDISALTSDGHGLGRFNGMAVFVPLSFTGDRIQAQITSIQKRFAQAKLLKVITPSPERITPTCPYFGECGACSLMHISYQSQLTAKHRIVCDSLERIGGFNGICVNDTIGAEYPFHYRNKSVFSFTNTDLGVVFGCFEKRSHQLVSIDDCLIQDEKAVKAMKIIKDWANEFGISAYDIKSKSGVLRYGVVRCTPVATMVIIVTTGKLPFSSELTHKLKAVLPDMVSLIHNINKLPSAPILGNENKLIYGNEMLDVTLGSLKFSVSPLSFLQVNSEQTMKLYMQAVNALNLNKNDIVMDLYCGIGTISLTVSQYVKKVIGIEVVRSAISDAKLNASINGITNAEFICGAVEKVLPSLLNGNFNPTAIILDPPRAGVERSAIDAIASSNVPKIAYISCNPATLARDCKIFRSLGYSISFVQPVDMFPQTEHIETVCLLTRKAQ